ncbi:MAG: adenylosuccinate lyase [Spirochaetia bacterium]|nr:adenylosuccinate lyase [Spirochaetia bacterium]
MIDRYSRKDMAGIWNLENKYRIWLEIELRVCDAWARRGVVSEADLKTIREKARFDLARIEEVEKEVQHDVIAFLTSVREFTGAPGRFIHHGMTSSDVGDTALCMQMVQSIDLILGGVDKVIAAAHALAVKYKTQIMVGRTHGIHAEPVTLGFKFAHFYAEMKRSRDRLVTARREIAVGKMSGAVGTFSNIEPDLEEEVLKSLGLEPDPIATQVVSRDRHAAVLSALAVTAGTLGRIAQEIRLLQKSEGREVEEPFSAGQKGSSAMPHKRNPVICERICGLARVVQSNVQTAYADMSLWHERDISHSSAERVIIPDSFLALDYILERAHYVLSNLNVYPDAMEKVLGTTRGLIFSQRLLLALVESGLPRDDAYRIVQ